MKIQNALPLASLLTDLSAIFGKRVRCNEPLSQHTTLRLGGLADIWLAVESVAELVEAARLARQHDVSIFMLGGGANLLISDAGIRGLVIENRARQVDFPLDLDRRSGTKVTIVTESGTVLPNLARRCAKRGLSGLEWAVGVPGTIGGAVVNNAGAYGSDMAHSLIRAELLSATGERLWQPVTWFQYDYRASRLKRQPDQKKEVRANAGWIVLKAELQMAVAPAVEVEAQLAAFNERRKTSQPPGATVGSMFKNPAGDYAGRLIEAVGLKGYRIGQAQISPVHANFFQNLGGARAADILRLIETAQKTVEDELGIKLELEIEVVGEFGEEEE